MPVGHEGDAVEVGDPGEVEGVGQVGVGDDHPVEPVWASSATPSATAPLRPRPGRQSTAAPSVAAQADTSSSSHTTATGSGAGGPDHLGGHVAGQRGAVVRVEGGGQAGLGVAERLDRHQDGDGVGTGRWVASGLPQGRHPASLRRPRSRKLPGPETRARAPTRAGAGTRRLPLRHEDLRRCHRGRLVGDHGRPPRGAQHETVLWARDPALAEEIQIEHRNSRYLEGYDLHPDLRASSDLEGGRDPGRRAW